MTRNQFLSKKSAALRICSFLWITTQSVPRLSAADEVVNIIVLSDIQNTLENRIKYEAVDIICDELRLSGFNVIDNRGSTFENGLKNELVKVFQEYPISAAIAVTQLSPRDGTVTLFVNRPNDGIKDLAAFYIEFPLNRDKAEVVAFKVSENVSLVTEGMTITKDSAEKFAEEKTTTDDAVIPIDPKKKVNENAFAVYINMGGEYSPGGTGFYGAPVVGFRWYPLVHKSLDLVVSYYPLGSDIEFNDDGASFDFLLAKLRGAHEFSVNRLLKVNLGLCIGFGYIWMRAYPVGNVGEAGVRSVYKDVADFFPYGGGSAELIFAINKRLWVPLRFDVGASMTKVSVIFSGAEVASFGLPIIELSLGLGILF